MKKLSVVFFLLLIFGAAYSQSHQGFKYQTVIRDPAGQPLSDSAISILMRIRSDSTAGAVIYSEIHAVVTNGFGMANLVIGDGDSQTGDFLDIQWGTRSFFLEISVDMDNTGSFQLMGVTEILGVPLAKVSQGLILTDENNKTYRIKVDTLGNLITESISSSWQCGEPITDDRDGREYSTVLIDEKCWIQANMNYEIEGSWCYDDDPANCEIYGRLYNWSLALEACPDGWHLPTDTEWCNMSVFLDPYVDCGVINFSGFVAGGMMKDTGTITAGTGLWAAPNSGATNESGFTALPAGARYANGLFNQKSMLNYLWSSTEESDTKAFGRTVGYNYPTIYRGSYNKELSLTVRCVKDE